MNLVEILREKSITSLFQANTFRESWSNWNSEINRILTHQFSENELINLGDHLSEIFKSTSGTDGRTQSNLSGGGAAWESLVCWYINLCSIGSRLIAIKKMSLVPKPIQDAITVNYGNFPCNTESDITLLIFPDLKEFTEDYSFINLLDREGNKIPNYSKNGELNQNLINHLVDLNFHKMGIGIIQCKTNWNDNAQIPMLWDMIYSVGGFRNRNITIGKNSYSIQNVREFSYSFVTVPSNKRGEYKPSSTSVKRVTNLSGGNYWGNPTVLNVAKSIKEIFGTNYNSAYTDGLRETIRRELKGLKSGEKYSYFNL
jgi:hypothetical protein